MSPTVAGSDAAVDPEASASSARAASFSPSRSRSRPAPRDMVGLTQAGSGGGGRLAGAGLSGRPAKEPATLSETQPAQPTASVRELLASRLAPCRPVLATSPQAHSPATLLRPAPSTAT